MDFYAHGLEVAPRKGARVFALGPSHFERKALTAAGFPWQEVGDGNILEFGPNGQQHVLGVASLPVYNQITLHLLRRAYGAYDQVVWCVSNCFLGIRILSVLDRWAVKLLQKNCFCGQTSMLGM